MRDLVLALLVCGAVDRLTRLFIRDRLPWGTLRQRLQDWAEDRWLAKQPTDRQVELASSETWNSKLAYFLSCPWCTSLWIAAILVAVCHFATGPSLPVPPLLVLAASTFAGLAASRE